MTVFYGYLIGIFVLALFLIVEAIPAHNKLAFEDDRKEFRFEVAADTLFYSVFWPITVGLILWFLVHRAIGYFFTPT